MEYSIIRRFAGATLVAAGAVVSSCQQQHFDDGAAPQPQRIAVVVRNGGFLDANVYAALPNGARGARLGTVTGNSTARLSMRVSDLLPGNVMMLRIHGIGARNDWLSQAVIVDPSDFAELNLMTDANNEYRYSNLYPRITRTAALPSRP
jgi:hypothetical protein